MAEIFFKSIYPYNALLLISGTNNGQYLPSLDQPRGPLVVNNKGAFLLTGNLVENLDLPLRVLVGNRPARKTHILHTFELSTDDKKIYIGDVRKESYMIIGITNETVKLCLSVDSNKNTTLVYIYLESPDVELVDRSISSYDQEDMEDEINKLGKEQGCHICGTKDENSYIPHLLPPEELDVSSDRRWYPICSKDYNGYKKEIAQILQKLI